MAWAVDWAATGQAVRPSEAASTWLTIRLNFMGVRLNCCVQGGGETGVGIWPAPRSRICRRAEGVSKRVSNVRGKLNEVRKPRTTVGVIGKGMRWISSRDRPSGGYDRRKERNEMARPRPNDQTYNSDNLGYGFRHNASWLLCLKSRGTFPMKLDEYCLCEPQARQKLVRSTEPFDYFRKDRETTRARERFSSACSDVLLFSARRNGHQLSCREY